MASENTSRLDDTSADEEISRDMTNVRFRDAVWPLWLRPSYLEWLEDDAPSSTLDAQQKTQHECTPYLLLDDDQNLETNQHGLPHLQRATHSKFLRKHFDLMPAPYQAMDAARPWFFYWVLQGLTALGEDVSEYRERLLGTLRPLQNATGGFAGGYGQDSHLATSYGCVLALAMVGGLDMVDRKAMWQFIGKVKQADGGFKVAIMAEEDVRGAYCAMVILTLLNLPLELPAEAPARAHGMTSFLDGLGEWIGRCQTYEGGIGGAPANEAHGAYAFCALACLSIIDVPERSITRYLDAPALLKWMVEIQTTPEGGFAGRTNKLVDACYSHWVGSCWAMLESALKQPIGETLWNRAGLIRYLLTCCQDSGTKGGMRDKPSARPDAYHTCYSLAGLSAASHYYHPAEDATQFDESGRCMAAFSWTQQSANIDELGEWCIDLEDVVQPVHPVFAIPIPIVDRCRKHYSAKGPEEFKTQTKLGSSDQPYK